MNNLYQLPVFGITGLSNIRFNEKALLNESAKTGDLRIGLFAIPNPEAVSDRYKTSADLRDDPFLILKATPFDNKDILRRKGEELALFDDENNVNDALNMVTSPASRINAEMHTVSFICRKPDDIDSFDELKNSTYWSDFSEMFMLYFTDASVPQTHLLAILNGMSHALVYSDWDPFEFDSDSDFIYHAVSAFDALNVTALTKELNAIRIKVGIAPISENKVEDALKERKHELIQDIEYMFSRMQTLSLMRYIYALGGYMKEQYDMIPDVLSSVFERCQTACFEFFDNNIEYVDRLLVNILESCLQKTDYQIRKYYICQLSRLMYPLILSCMPNEVKANYARDSHDKRCVDLLDKLSQKALTLSLGNYFSSALEILAIRLEMSELLFLSDGFSNSSETFIKIVNQRKDSISQSNSSNFNFNDNKVSLSTLGWRIGDQQFLFFRDIVSVDLNKSGYSFVLTGKCVCENNVYKNFNYSLSALDNDMPNFLLHFSLHLGFQRLMDIVARIEEDLPQKAKVILKPLIGTNIEFYITKQGLLSTDRRLMLFWKNLSMHGKVTVDNNDKMCLELSYTDSNRRTIYKIYDLMNCYAFTLLYGNEDHAFHKTHILDLSNINP